LDWKPISHHVVDVVYREYTRGPPRRRKEFKLAKEERALLLMSSGFSMDEIMACEDEGRKIRKQRLATLRADKLQIQGNAFQRVLSRAKDNLEQSIKNPKFDLRRIVPNSIDAVGTTVGKMGSLMSSAVTNTTSRLSFSAKKHQAEQATPRPAVAAAT